MARTPNQLEFLRQAKEDATSAKSELIKIWIRLQTANLPSGRLGRAIDALERWQNT